MLIRSSFKDYYDSAAGAGVDTSLVFVRETVRVKTEQAFRIDHLPAFFPDDKGEVREDDYSVAAIERANQKVHTNFIVIGFCGVLYVGVVNTLRETESFHNVAHFGEDILSLDWSENKSWRRPSERSTVETCLQQWHGKKDDTLFKELNAPIFSIDISNHLNKYQLKNIALYQSDYYTNPNLKNFQFYKIVDAYTAFQSVQMYISGVLGVDSKPMVEISNTSKILKAGFDLKTSFRKDKEK